MVNNYLLPCIALFVSTNALSQWSNNGNNIFNTNSGQVSIGTSLPNTDPTVKLSVYNSAMKTTLVVGNPSTGTGGFTSLLMGTSADTDGFSFVESIKSSGSLFGDLIFNRFGGNVGIGTTSPTDLLDVNGNVRLRGIRDGFGNFLWKENQNNNTFFGTFPSNSLTTGTDNSAFGYGALSNLSTGSGNVAVGIYAGGSSLTGFGNVAIGGTSLLSNNTGNYNTAVGGGALYFTTGSKNTAIGNGAGFLATSIENSTAIGFQAPITASNQIRMGNSSVTSIGGQVSWSTLSDGRFKNEVKEDVVGLEFIKLLRPVSYTVDKTKFEAFLGIPDSLRSNVSASARVTTAREIGFVAQEVEHVLKKMGYNFSGVEVPQNEKDHYSIRYSDFVVPLTKAIQELNDIVEKQQRTIDILKKNLEEKESKKLDVLDAVELFQNAPNPFDEETEIKMKIPNGVQNAILLIYDLTGKQLEKIVINERGEVKAKLEVGKLTAGMYLYSLFTDGQIVGVKRMILTD